MKLEIRTPRPADKAQWLALWRGYLEFYEQVLTTEQIELTWSRVLGGTEGIFGLVAVSEQRLVGLAHYFWTPSTWIKHRDLYLEDLFVAQTHRKRGIAEALIEELAKIARAAGAEKVHWQTQRKNLSAQSLYERLATKSEYVSYDKKLS